MGLAVFLHGPGGAKGLNYFFRERPAHTVNASERLLRLPNHNAPGGVYAHYYGVGVHHGRMLRFKRSRVRLQFFCCTYSSQYSGSFNVRIGFG